MTNTAIGSLALDANTTGDENVAIGYGSLTSHTNGNHNTAVGRGSLRQGTSGSNNTAVGTFALDLVNSSNNTAVGEQSIKNCTSGQGNTACGAQTLNTCSSGNYNVAIGRQALTALTTADTNTAVGFECGSSVTPGANNLLLGYQAGRSGSPSGNITTSDNSVCLGNNNIQNLFCADTSISSSDSRDKTDVADFTKGLDWIKALRPVTYRWDRRTWYGTEEQPFGTPDGSKKRQRLHIGFLAQEALAVEQANGYGSSNDDSLLVNLTDDGMSYGMKYERLVPILVNAIKELETRLAAVEAA